MKTQIVWVYKPTNHRTFNRLDMKKYLGGEVAFNKALKNGDVYSFEVKTYEPNDIKIFR